MDDGRPARGPLAARGEDGPHEVVLAGTSLHAMTEAQVVAHVERAWENGRGGWIHTVNLDHLRMLRGDEDFRAASQEADLRVADGAPLIWASRLQGTPLPERVAGSDLIRSLTGAAARSGRRVLFLGGNPGAAEEAVAILQRETPGFAVAGIDCPPFGFEKDPEELARVRRLIEGSDADLVFLAVGAPKSEFLIRDLKSLLPKAWWAGIGISFSFVSGEVRRAPRWVQRIGLEWVHRLLQEPRRLAKRYLVHGLPFAARLFVGAVGGRLRPRRRGA